MSTTDPRDPKDQRPQSPASLDDVPRIYVASLTDYNAGTLHGEWIEADQDADEILAEVQSMLASSPTARRFPQGGPAEEWAIHDYEGFGSWQMGEWESFETVSAIAAAIVEHGEGPVSAFVSNHGSWDSSSFEDAYIGVYDSVAAYAEELAEEIGLMDTPADGETWGRRDARRDLSSEWPFTCIDWERAGRELEMGGDIWTADAPGFGQFRTMDGLYVFRNV